MTQTDPTSPGTQTSTEEPSVAQRAREAGDRLQSQYQDLEQAYGDTRARLEEFNEQAVGFIRENPGLCIAGAVAVGFVVGRLAARRWLS